jgi:hypothetical protein
MKLISRLLLMCGIMSIAFLSCKKDSSDEPNYGALTGNTLKGKISLWTLGGDKKLTAHSSSSFDMIGESAISSDGSFNLTLSAPGSGAMDAVADFFDDRLTYSDPSAECSSSYLYVTDSAGSYIGYVERSSTIAEYQKGYCFVEYLYLTKSTSVTGNVTYTDTEETDNGVFNLNLKAGWNTVVYTMTNVTTTNGIVVVDFKVNSIEPSTVNWTYSSK